MKNLHQIRTNELVDAIVTELNLDSDLHIEACLRKVIEAKNTHDSLHSLEYLLQTILRGQGKDFYYSTRAGA